jgi:hypothetical protein
MPAQPQQLARNLSMILQPTYQSSIPTAFLLAMALSGTAVAQTAIPLKEAKLNIEHNFTDRDTGFQGAIDSEGWKDITVTGPGGVILKFEAAGKLRGLGLTELFFESVEPKNSDVPIKDVLARLPEGNYVFSGSTPGGEQTVGTALLTHDIPKGPTLLSPPDGSTVPHADLPVAWTAVNRTIGGKPIDIIAYQLIVERDRPVHPHMIGKRNGLSMYLPPNVTRMTVPKEFLQPGVKYTWEVLAIEPSGNQTLSEAGFSTN